MRHAAVTASCRLALPRGRVWASRRWGRLHRETPEPEALTPAHLKAVIVRRDEFDRGVRMVLEEGMSKGVFARGDQKLLAFAVLGAVNWIPRWFNPSGEATSQEIADLFADFFIAGLRRANS